MLGARITKQVASRVSVRHGSSAVPSALYNNVWKKSNIRYIAYIATGCVVLGSLYGSTVSYVWEVANRGKLYHHIDWSKFKSEDDE